MPLGPFHSIVLYSTCIQITFYNLFGIILPDLSSAEKFPLRMPKHLHFQPRTSRLFPTPKVYRCGAIGKELVVNFVNQNYPEDDSGAGECTFRLVIQSHGICQIRVDLVDTELLPPSRGECLSQALTVEGSIWPSGLPPICGINNDQHFYLHLEPWVANSSLIDFKVATFYKGRSYRFGIWVTQIDCSTSNVLQAPAGCTQYFLSEGGSIKSFNFEGQRYFIGQNYQICIRPGRGVCGIRYESSDFGIKKGIQGPKEMQLRSGVGAGVCSENYVMIPEGRDTVMNLREKRLLFRRRKPQRTTSPPVAVSKRKLEVPSSQDRFCGGNLSPSGGEAINKPVFARVRSNLISFRFKTSPLQELTGKAEALNLSTGFHIKYTQLRNCQEDELDLVAEPSVATIMHAMQVPLPINEDGSNKTGAILGQNEPIDREDDIGEDDTIWEYLEPEDEEDEDVYDYFD